MGERRKKRQKKSECPDPFRLFSYFFGHEGYIPEHDESLIGHLDDCPNCRRLIEAWEKIDRELTSTVPRTVPPEIREMIERVAAGGDVLAVIRTEPHLKLSLPGKVADLLGFRLLLSPLPEPVRAAEFRAGEEPPACRVSAVDPSTLGLEFCGSEAMIERVALADFIVVYSEQEKGTVIGRVARSRSTELRVRFPDVNFNLPFHILIIQ